MTIQCACGSRVQQPFHQLVCLECGAPCCAQCAVPMESVAYCRRCARLILGSPAVAAGGSFELY